MKVKCITGGQLDTNCYLVVNDDETHAVLIDPGFYDSMLESIIVKYKDIIDAVLLTHMHFDHIMGLEYIKSVICAPIYIHKLDFSDMTDPDKNCYSSFYGANMDFSGFKANRFFTDNSKLSFGDLVVSVFHTPGHTKGGVCYLINDCLFTGDTLFKESVGNPNFYGGDARILLKSVNAISNFTEDYCIFPGHGEESTLLHEKRYNPYMRDNQWI